MRIVCPACAAAYEVPDERLLPGRVVRCARCETDWTPLAADPSVPEAPPEPLPPEPATEPAALAVVPAEPAIPTAVIEVMPQPVEPRRVKQSVALWAAWVASVAAVLAALWFGYSARETVMRTWPPSIRAYAALGLAGQR